VAEGRPRSFIYKEVAVHPKGLAALLMTAAASAAVMVAGSATASAEPLHYLVPHVFAQPPTTADCEADFGIACYNPNQLETAYGMPLLYRIGLTGAGETIAIVDSYGSPTIQSDLTTFDEETGLPAPPSFNIIKPDGPIPPFDPNSSDVGGWAIETSLDVEYAHAMAPGANILLVETPVSETEGITGFPQIVEAENYVIDHHLAGVITQSFGATEQTFTSPSQILALRSAYINAAASGVTVLAASGDAGATDDELDETDYFPFRAIDWPSSDPLVTSVGGTQLHLNAFGARTAPDNVWNDSFDVCGGPCAGGGGQSTVFSRPSYQNSVASVVGSARGTPDVSMSAAVDGGANVYLGFTSPGAGITPGWYIIGGTSEASPLFSGIVAVADQSGHHWLGQINPTLYAFGDQGPLSGITDITSGNNTVTFTNTVEDPGTYTVTGFNAVRGYDMASGLGTANGPFLVAELALSPFH
jgi:subtilase family serine protease